jgi:hypothetical protein
LCPVSFIATICGIPARTRFRTAWACDDEKLVLEEGSRSVGRIRTKRTDGPLAWMPLLPSETINQSILDRATAKNPQGAQKPRELDEIVSMHESAANLAAAEVREILGS